MKSELLKALEKGHIVKLKKGHPCGENSWEIIRLGMDIKLRCTNCKSYVSLTRKKFNKAFRDILN